MGRRFHKRWRRRNVCEEEGVFEGVIKGEDEGM